MAIQKFIERRQGTRDVRAEGRLREARYMYACQAGRSAIEGARAARATQNSKDEGPKGNEIYRSDTPFVELTENRSVAVREVEDVWDAFSVVERKISLALLVQVGEETEVYAELIHPHRGITYPDSGDHPEDYDPEQDDLEVIGAFQAVDHAMQAFIPQEAPAKLQ